MYLWCTWGRLSAGPSQSPGGGLLTVAFHARRGREGRGRLGHARGRGCSPCREAAQPPRASGSAAGVQRLGLRHPERRHGGRQQRRRHPASGLEGKGLIFLVGGDASARVPELGDPAELEERRAEPALKDGGDRRLADAGKPCEKDERPHEQTTVAPDERAISLAGAGAGPPGLAWRATDGLGWLADGRAGCRCWAGARPRLRRGRRRVSRRAPGTRRGRAVPCPR